MVCIATHDQPYQIRSITYTVESASVPGVTYLVLVTEDGWSCSCKASEYSKTRGKCWHIKQAQAGELLGKPRVRVGVVPPATTQRSRDLAALASMYVETPSQHILDRIGA
jgi:hypothetical protein